MHVIDAFAGGRHSLVVARQKNDNSEAKVYAFGENTNNKLANIKSTKEKVLIPHVIEFFDDKSSIRIFGGNNHNFILTQARDISKDKYNHRVECKKCKANPIIGSLFISAFNIHEKYCKNCVEQTPSNKDFEILYFIKEAITTNKENEWPTLQKNPDFYLNNFEDNNKKEFTNFKCNVCQESPIKNVAYINAHEQSIADILCEKCVVLIKEKEISPSVYYRITKPLKDKNSLPISPRNLFYDLSDSYGYNMTIAPNFNEKGYDYLIKKYNSSFESFINDFKNIVPEVDEQIVDLINNLALKNETSIYDFEENFSIPKDEINSRNAIAKWSADMIRKRFLVLNNFNKKIQEILPFIDFSAKKNQINRLRNLYSNISPFLFWEVKSELFDAILEKDAKTAPSHRVKVNRMKSSKFILKGKFDHTGEFTVFGQVYQQVKKVGYNIFKVAKDIAPFNVDFIGEASIDVGGPYRDVISQICIELQSTALPLFIPSPNQKNDSGQNREK